MESLRAVNFGSLLLMAYVICELQAFCAWPANGNVAQVSSANSSDEKYTLQQLVFITHSVTRGDNSAQRGILEWLCIDQSWHDPSISLV